MAIRHTITILYKGKLHKICKIWFGSDGSYYVAVPYHPANKAVLFKQTVNFDASAPKKVDDYYVTPLSEAIDMGSSDDARIKLSHHPDGFIHFSGDGLISGRKPDGSPKGIGIQSWPLKLGCRGPAFSLSIWGIEQFGAAEVQAKNQCILNYDQLTVIPGTAVR